MKLHLLRYFAVLAEELHFGRAAERLAITQPPLSSGIKALEEGLGVKLFERSSKHVALTAAGRAYLAEVRAVLERVERAGALARLVASGQQGRLEVGFAASMVYRDMPAVVRAFARQAPGIEVQLREMSSSDQIQALQRGQLDAGFINTASLPPRLAGHPLAPDRLLCCLPADHRLADRPALDLPALAQEQFVMFAREASPALHDQVMALLQQAGVHPRTSHAARQWLTVVALVAQGMGVALVPASLQRSGEQGVRWIPLAGGQPAIASMLVWPESAHHPALQAFIGCAAGTLAPGFLQSPP